MLDDLKIIHERDTQDNLGSAGHQAEQLDYAFELPHSSQVSDIYNVVIIADSYGRLVATTALGWLKLGVPVEVVTSEQLPAYIGERTLCIVVDNVGLAINTDNVVRIEAGRRLWQGLKAMAVVFDSYGLTHGKALELASQQQWLAGQVAAWDPQKATSHNQAKQIALELLGRSVVVYADTAVVAVAQKWQADINGNAKQLAWLGDDKVFGYAGFAGWTKQPVHKVYAIIELRLPGGKGGDDQLFTASDRLLSGLKPSPVTIEVQGDTVLQRLLYAGALSDFVSAYLAILNGVSPAESPIIARLHKELS